MGAPRGVRAAVAERTACSRTCAGRAAWCRRRSRATCAAAGAGATRDLAVAVNGRIEAVGRSFYLDGRRDRALRADGAGELAARGAQRGRAVRGRRRARLRAALALRPRACGSRWCSCSWAPRWPPRSRSRMAGRRGTRAAELVERRPPVVIVVLDEFPADTLIGPDGQIDAARYPNFAALARTSTWFRNGQTVYDSTFKAVPAILDARMPRAGHRARRAQPPAEHLPPDGPARLRRGQGRVRHPPSARRGSAPARAPGGPACSSGWPAAGGRRACTSGSARIRDRPRPDVLLPPRAAPARAVDLPAVGPPEPPARATTRSRASTGRSASTTRSSPTTTTCATCSRSATSTASSA